MNDVVDVKWEVVYEEHEVVENKFSLKLKPHYIINFMICLVVPFIYILCPFHSMNITKMTALQGIQWAVIFKIISNIKSLSKA